MDFDIEFDLTDHLQDNWKDFRREFVPIYLKSHPEKSKIGAGLACGMTWTLTKGMQVDDIVMCPTGEGNYRIGKITGEYRFVQGEQLPHRRDVKWFDIYVAREDLSLGLKNATGSIGTISEISTYENEVSSFIAAEGGTLSPFEDKSIEEPSVFVLEKYLEDFLVANWAQTELGNSYQIFSDENGTGQQYATDAGRIDILALSKSGKELLVVELKKGRASDAVVGQVLRYMGYVSSELAAPNQKVRGVIIALEDDLKLRYALRMVPNVDFYRYEVNFKLAKVEV